MLVGGVEDEVERCLEPVVDLARIGDERQIGGTSATTGVTPKPVTVR